MPLVLKGHDFSRAEENQQYQGVLTPEGRPSKPPIRYSNQTLLPTQSQRPTFTFATPPNDYIELHASSAFSFLAGSSAPESYIERAVEIGMPAMALADRNGLYGVRPLPHLRKTQ